MRPVQKVPFSLPSIVDHHGEASGCGNHKLLQLLVCMPSTHSPGGHIIEVIHAPDGKGHVAVAFNESKVAALIGDLGQINDPYCGVLRGALGRRGFGPVLRAAAEWGHYLPLRGCTLSIRAMARRPCFGNLMAHPVSFALSGSEAASKVGAQIW